MNHMNRLFLLGRKSMLGTKFRVFTCLFYIYCDDLRFDTLLFPLAPSVFAAENGQF